MPAQQLRLPDASAATVKNHDTRHQEIDHIANALGHVALLYFTGEIVDAANNRHQGKTLTSVDLVMKRFCTSLVRP